MPYSEPVPAAPAIFLHVPKTAGTTLRSLLHERLGDSLCWYRRADSLQPLGAGHPRVLSDLSTLGSPEAWRGLRVLGGHFPAWHLPLALRERRPLLMAVLRDPLQRLESLYAYIRRETSHPLHATLSTLSFHEALQHTPFGRMVPQGQLRFLRTVQRRWRSVTVAEQLAPFPVLIGKHEHLPAFVEALSRRTGIPLALQAASANVSPAGYRHEIAAQSGYAEACRLIEDQTQDERAFLASFEVLYEHPAGDGPVEPDIARRTALPVSSAPSSPEGAPATLSPERATRRQARRDARRAQRQAGRHRPAAGSDTVE